MMAIFDAATVSSAEIAKHEQRFTPVTLWGVLSTGLLIGWLFGWALGFLVGQRDGEATCPTDCLIVPVLNATN